MPEFSYVAVDASGKKITGTVAAATQREAVAAVSARDLFPLEVRGEATDAAALRRRRVPAQLMAVTYGQLADLLRSGVPLLRAIQVIRGQVSHPALKEVLGEVARRVEDGASLADAVARFPGCFGEMAVSMIRAGGEGGFLEDALVRVAAFTDASEDLRKRVMGAMAYPVLLFLIGTVVVSGLLVFLVPRFQTLFESLRQRNELPALTEGLLAASDFLQNWGLWILLLIGLTVWAVRGWLKTETGRRIWDRYILRVPVAGNIFLSFAVARFCRILGTLLQNGVPILRSLEIAGQATGNRVLSDAVQKATENISAGQSLAAPLAACKLFPPMVIEMISVAEEANTLETVLVQIADALERRTWRQLELGVRLLEPIMLLIIAGIVLVVVIALLLPVLKMSTTI